MMCVASDNVYDNHSVSIDTSPYRGQFAVEPTGTTIPTEELSMACPNVVEFEVNPAGAEQNGAVPETQTYCPPPMFVVSGTLIVFDPELQFVPEYVGPAQEEP
jgi:hypothetical protein